MSEMDDDDAALQASGRHQRDAAPLRHQRGQHLFDSIVDVFAGLGALLVLSVLALWPGSGRPEQVEDELGRRSWADRVRLAKGTESKDDA
jgi:hypothetical protein